MSLSTYILFDSTNRNRSEYPNQGEFVMQSFIQRDGEQAADPISSAAVERRWIANDFETTAHTLEVAGTIVKTTGYGDLDTIIEVVAATGNTFHREPNYYTNAVIHDGTGSATYATRILNSEFMGEDSSGKDRMKFTLVHKLSGANINHAVHIRDPTDLTNTLYPLIFVPYGPPIQDAYTANYIIYNETYSISQGSPQYRKIKHYCGDTHLVHPDVSTGIVTGWTGADTYSIRKEPPSFNSSVPASAGSGSSSVVPIGSDAPDITYTNTYIHMTSGTAQYETRRIRTMDVTSYADAAVGGSTTTVVFPSGASSVDDTYVGASITMTSGLATGETRVIGGYVGSTRTATVTVAFSAAVASPDTFTVAGRSVTTASPFSGNVVTADSFELWVITSDNHKPFSTYSQITTPVCCEIRMVHLILPNTLITGSYGGYLPAYPYLFVTVSNSPDISGDNIIQTNNRNVPTAVFQLSLDDCSRSDMTSFLKLKGNGMVQKVKLSSANPLYIGIHLPDGSLYKTLTPDFESPLEPNSALQISALFQINEIL
jgi:hypothetical protein